MGQKRIIYACDIGSTSKQSFAWARVNPEDGVDGVIQVSSRIDRLVWHLESDIQQGCSISLGFEAPLFIPVPEDWKDLSKGREGDGNRSWSAPSGAYVATLGIHQSAWILRRLHESSSDKCEFTLDWQRWYPASSHKPILFCWEAFVSGYAHAKDDKDGDEHRKDAATAADNFRRYETNLQEAMAPVRAKAPLSLIGSVALWCGWVSNPKSILHEQTLVIKPKESFKGVPKNIDYF